MEDSENITVASETDEIIDQDAKHMDPQEPKCTAADSKPEGGTESTGGGANEENEEQEKNTKAETNDSEACEREGGVTENVNTVKEEAEVKKKEEEITGQADDKQEEDTEEKEVTENKESVIAEEVKESDNESLKENDSDKTENCEKEERHEKNHKEEEQRTDDSEGKAEKTEDQRDTKEVKENKDDSKEKHENSGKKSGSAPSSAFRAPTKSSACSRAARPSARRDAMAKFQKDQTPGVRNFKVQRTSIGMAGGASIKQKILQWCRNKTQKYEGVCIENFSSSWSDGLAFCALIHRFFPSAFDFSSLKASERENNFTLAFNTAESLADCCPLLEVSDMLLMGNNPDPLCVFTYVQSLCHHLSKIDKERREKKEEEKKQEENQEETEVNEKEEGEKEESEQNEETEESGVDSSMKTEQETDKNETAIHTDVAV